MADFRVLLGYASYMRVQKIRLAVCLILIASTLPAQQTVARNQSESLSSTSSLTILTPSHPAVSLAAADLKAMPQLTVTIHNLHTNAEETYSGVRLMDILTRFNAPLGSELRGKALANYIVAAGSDGYKAVLALAEVDPSFHPGEVLVANMVNGKPLDEHSGPLKLVVTEDKRPARSVRNLISIELKEAQ